MQCAVEVPEVGREILEGLLGNLCQPLEIGAQDLKPALDERTLDGRLLRDMDAQGKLQFRTLLKGLLPRKLITVACDLTAIPPTREVHQITAQERARLRAWLKNFRMTGSRLFFPRMWLRASMPSMPGI